MNKTILLSIAAFAVGVSGLFYTATSHAEPQSDQIKGKIIVKFRDARSSASILKQHGLKDGKTIGSTGAHLISVPAGKEARLIEVFSNNPAVEYAEPDYTVTSMADESYFSRQYALQNTGQSFTNTAGTMPIAGGINDADVDAVEAWSTGWTGAGIKVAILDSGVASDNEDIKYKVVGRVNYSGAATSEDNYGHGTHVAGIVAATDNGFGVTGVCPGCTILDGKVLNDSGSGSTSGIADGINWATANGAKVINMSLGQRTSSRTLEAAVNNAWKAGAVIVAAAGNGGNQTKIYPGAYTNVIAVAATNNSDAKASFSTYGAKWVDVAAPGENVYSTFPNHEFYLGKTYNRSTGYDVANGTSMASPVVAGVAALAWASHATATNVSVRANVETTAEKIPGTGTYWIHGRVNAFNAVQ